MRRLAPCVVAAACLIAAPAALGASCPTSADAGQFATTGQLLRDNAVEARFGERPSGSTNQGRFIAWLQQRFSRIPGMRLDSIPHPINRWTETGAGLAAGPSTKDLGKLP